MTIKQQKTGDVLTLCVEGRLDTVTAPDLDKELQSIPEDVKKLILDCSKLVYVSSAGLRVILKAQKMMSGKGSMILRNVCEMVLEVFEITGFTDILTIEQ